MAHKEEKYELRDYGLTDPAVLEAATRMAPALFTALRLAHTLDQSHYPIESDDAIERALITVADDDKQYTHSGTRITAKAAKDRFPNELLPIADKLDLLRKVYQAILISHRESSRLRWERVNNGTEPLKASHPLPKEVV